MTLARMVGNRAFRQLVQRDLPPPNRQLPGRVLPADAEMVELSKVEFTQPRVDFTTRDGQTLGKMARDMVRDGWDVTRPADIVRIQGDKGERLVTLDHRRLFAAQRAGIKQISARVHGENDEMDNATAGRFAIQRG